MKCKSPHCLLDQAEDSLFCEYHRDQLAAVASDIDAGKADRLRSPGRRRRELPPKFCDVPECSRRTEPRESYCAHHLKLFARGSR